MSELKVDKVSPRTGNYIALNTVGSKNIIINGDMSIAQRGTSQAGLGNGNGGYHTVDRWRFSESGTPTYVFTMSQDTDVPSGQGFAKSLKIDFTTADASLAANDLLRITQIFEGQNLQYLKYGTSSAQSLTASFWVKSSVIGDYNTHLLASGATNRIITSTFTINSADTWEKKTITFAGDTAQVISNDNSGRLQLTITLLAGTDYTSTDGTSWGTYSTSKIAYGQTANVASSTANNFWVTGVQLEAGTTASDFEFLPYDVNLDRCERYYQILAKDDNVTICNAASFATNNAYGVFNFKKEMRAAPSLDQNTGSIYYQYVNSSAADNFDSFTLELGTTKNCRLVNADTIAISNGQAGWFQTNNVASFVALDAEL